DGFVDEGLHVDETGILNGNLVVASSTGGIWKINSAGTATPIGRVTDTDYNNAVRNVELEGVTTIPNDTRYGLWAGKILAGGIFRHAYANGSDRIAIYVINPSDGTSHPESQIVFPPGLAFTEIEDIFVIPPNQNFYGVDYKNQ